MALFKVFKGASANLPAEMHDGYCYFTTDDGIFYIDYLDTDGVTLRRKPISGPGKSIEYIVGTQTATTGSWTGVTKDSSLEIGKTIAYKLPYEGNGNASLTLTFTNPTGNATSGAIAVYTNSTRVTTHYKQNAVILLTYDGTYWRASEYWNSDYKVRQTNDTSNTNYRVLLSYGANNDQVDNITHKSGNLIYNPSANKLSTGNIELTGALDVTGNADFHNATTTDSLTAGSLIVNGNSRFLNDVDFTQIPTAPTAPAGTNTTQLATTQFVTTAVSQGFGANDAMVFKGTLGSGGTVNALPMFGYSAGWTYRVVTAGSYAGEYCEEGDLIIAINDGPSSGSSLINTDWAKVEHNIDGALYKTNAIAYTGGKVLMSSGTGGAVKEGTTSTASVIKSVTFSAGSVPTLGTEISADNITNWSAGTLPTLGTAISADDITAWDAGSAPTLGTAFSVPNVTGNTSVTASKVTKTEDNTVVKTISQANSTSSIIGTVTDGVLTLSQAITAVGAVTAGSTATASAVTIVDVTASKVTLGTAFSIPNITSVGSAPSLTYTERSIPNVTGVGTLPSLSYATKTIPNITDVGTAPTLTTSTRTVVTGIS